MATRKGDLAKQDITNTILGSFSSAFVYDKKIYVTVEDGPGGELVQIALSLTMPKTPINPAGTEVTSAPTQATSSPQTSAPANIELSQEDKDAVARLMAELGIKD